MSDAEIERIFRSLDRIEARIAKLEELEAMRKGEQRASDMTRSGIMLLIAGVSCLTGIVTGVVTYAL